MGRNVHERMINKIGNALGLQRDAKEDMPSWTARVRGAYEEGYEKLGELERDAALLKRMLRSATQVLIDMSLNG